MKHFRAFSFAFFLFAASFSARSVFAADLRLRCDGYRKDSDGFNLLIFAEGTPGRVSKMDLSIDVNGGSGGFKYIFWGTPNGDALIRTVDSRAFLSDQVISDKPFAGRILVCTPSKDGCNPNSAAGWIRFGRNWGDSIALLQHGKKIPISLTFGEQRPGGPFMWATQIDLNCENR